MRRNSIQIPVPLWSTGGQRPPNTPAVHTPVSDCKKWQDVQHSIHCTASTLLAVIFVSCLLIHLFRFSFSCARGEKKKKSKIQRHMHFLVSNKKKKSEVKPGRHGLHLSRRVCQDGRRKSRWVLNVKGSKKEKILNSTHHHQSHMARISLQRHWMSHPVIYTRLYFGLSIPRCLGLRLDIRCIMIHWATYSWSVCIY